jgi:hypothetical protein
MVTLAGCEHFLVNAAGRLAPPSKMRSQECPALHYVRFTDADGCHVMCAITFTAKQLEIIFN